MEKIELAYAKQALSGVKDWDLFQAVLRTWTKIPKKNSARQTWPNVEKKMR